jgi:hypothetical protein
MSSGAVILVLALSAFALKVFLLALDDGERQD